jgi:hypothetical protein
MVVVAMIMMMVVMIVRVIMVMVVMMIVSVMVVSAFQPGTTVAASANRAHHTPSIRGWSCPHHP